MHLPYVSGSSAIQPRVPRLSHSNDEFSSSCPWTLIGGKVSRIGTNFFEYIYNSNQRMHIIII